MQFWEEMYVINYVYQLLSPGNFAVSYEDITIRDEMFVRPLYMAICQADQRYYLGKRDARVLKAKLPMALIHESVGEVLYDPSGVYTPGQRVAIIPNIPAVATPENNCNEVIFENYQKGSKFMSSGMDGFMREFVNVPTDRVVSVENVEPRIASICEFLSVGIHAVSRFEILSHEIKSNIGIWGDGSLGYIVACILREKFPHSHISVIGKNEFKLSQFTFVDETYLADDLPERFEVDHAFECAGGSGSFYAIDDIINHINPQGTVVLLGVSENKIAINTRDILEKGLSVVGCSRSGKTDFEGAAKLLAIPKFQSRLSRIIFEDNPVKSISDIHRVFKNDLNTAFKTVFRWDL